MIAFILYWLQRRCTHPSHMVVADLNEGDLHGGDVQLKWCRRCGAVRKSWYMGCTTPEPWRLPEPRM
jgi:hypothetical protein